MIKSPARKKRKINSTLKSENPTDKLNGTPKTEIVEILSFHVSPTYIYTYILSYIASISLKNTLYFTNYIAFGGWDVFAWTNNKNKSTRFSRITSQPNERDSANCEHF